MSRKVSKRKRPSRDEHMMREMRIDEAALDIDTMRRLSKFYNKQIITHLKRMLATGKEADIYVADAGISPIVEGKSEVILKFFRIGSSSFTNMQDYIKGDPRFKHVESGKFAIVRIWCRKEFGNLKMAKEGGVSVPTPYLANYNILAMEFIGEDTNAAKKLKDVQLDINHARHILNLIIQNIKLLYQARLVHGDLSEYNVLLKEEIPYIIDLGQAVVTKHPNARAFLKRDVYNIANYFYKTYKIESDVEEIYLNITGKAALQ